MFSKETCFQKQYFFKNNFIYTIFLFCSNISLKISLKTCYFFKQHYVFEENKKIEMKFFSKKYCFQKQVSFENKFLKTIFLQKHDVSLKSNKILINITYYINFVYLIYILSARYVIILATRLRLLGWREKAVLAGYWRNPRVVMWRVTLARARLKPFFSGIWLKPFFFVIYPNFFVPFEKISFQNTCASAFS